MQRYNTIIAVIIMIMAAACSTAKYIPTDKSDSTTIIKEVIYRDSLIYIPVPVESDSAVTEDDSSHLETSIALSDAWIREGKLHHSLSNKAVSLPYRFAIPETRITTERKSLDVKIMEVKKELTRWQRIKLEAGGIAIGAFALAIAYIIFSFLQKFK